MNYLRAMAVVKFNFSLPWYPAKFLEVFFIKLIFCMHLQPLVNKLDGALFGGNARFVRNLIRVIDTGL